MSEPVFLALDEGLAIHADQLRRYGGAGGVRDLGLRQSALGMPQAGFGDEYVHTTQTIPTRRSTVWLQVASTSPT